MTRIARLESRHECVPLARPYAIAGHRIDQAEIFFLELEDERGRHGFGSASPAPEVTGETPAACAEALAPERLEWLIGADSRRLGTLCRRAGEAMAATPAARAAVEIALHDLLARELAVPLVDLRGRCHDALPTSLTIGILDTDETLAVAAEALSLGFHCLKVKLGGEAEADATRLARLRERVGPDVAIRVDANCGYEPGDLAALDACATALNLELVEQPLARGAEVHLRELPETSRRRLVLDESVRDERDALALAAPRPTAGVFNLKLMKCGGLTPARAIADIAGTAGVALMWGCNDESAASIAAALHLAYACPATRFLDLDGSFNLAHDRIAGGFVVEDGRMRLVEAPGLGTEKAA